MNNAENEDRARYGILRCATNKRTGEREFIYRLNVGSGFIDPKSVLWFRMNEGESWPDENGVELFKTAIRLGRSLAFRFLTLDDACNFMRHLEPACIDRFTVH
jgi:hypothetical protein